jgi:hypothetical protein
LIACLRGRLVFGDDFGNDNDTGIGDGFGNDNGTGIGITALVAVFPSNKAIITDGRFTTPTALVEI